MKLLYSASQAADTRKESSDMVLYHSFRKAGDGVLYETENDFNLLDVNAILETVRMLYREKIGVK